MAGRYTLTIRTGPKVERERFDELASALDALEARLAPLEGSSLRDTVDLRYREFAPVAQVAVRGEVAGPGRLLAGVHGGVDLRGDGSAEAYVGRVRRRLVERRKSETVYAALRRALTDRGHVSDHGR